MAGMQTTDAAIETFRRTMRRHEKRARSMGLSSVAGAMGWIRRNSEANRSGCDHIAEWIRREHKREGGRCRCPSVAFFYERAADAVARLRGAS